LIPISKVSLGAEVETRVLEVLRSGVIAQGPVVAEFESKFAELSGAKHAIAMSNGTITLVAALQALELQPGDEVITSPFTFVATLNAILEAGATAVFADINEDDFNLNPDAVKDAITPRTRVIMPVHLYGQMADMGPIMELAKERGLRVIEDSAQAHGAEYFGKPAGSFDIASFSFYATKNLTTGEGGILTTNDDELAEKLRIMRNQGMRRRYEYVMAGHNYRMTDLQAALVIPQLETYADNVARRQSNADYYESKLSGLKGLITPKTKAGRRHVWHQYTLRITSDCKVTREELSEFLASKNIGSGFYYPKLVFDYPTFDSRNDIRISDLPVAEKIVKEVISIPVHPGLNEGDREIVADTIMRVVNGEI
jgi:dTDP-4-amino-4,6-dideoxygalactose transaminase